MSIDCSSAAREVGEPLAGTAPVATCWILIEQPGPWGKNALLDARLEPGVGELLTARAEGTGVSILLVRHPDRLEPASTIADRNVWVVHTCPGATRMRHGTMPDVSVIADCNFSELAAGALPPFGVSTSQPLLLVCTHSGRDACCALHGRALITDLLQNVSVEDRGFIWESSHIGGHRFAPTVMSLPCGAVFGRLTVDNAIEIFSGSQQLLLTPDNYRGRTCYSPPLQVAEIAVRQNMGIFERDVLDVLRVIDDRALPMPALAQLPGVGESLVAEVRHEDGRAWQVNLRCEELTQPRPKSCGSEPTTAAIWRSVGLAEATPWHHG